jgi:hypothetical protein
MRKIIDFATSFDQELWNQYQQYLNTTDDRLKDNYVGLDPRDFSCFPVVVIDNQIVCFSALQLNKAKWGDGIGRVSTRLWIHPDYRHNGKFTGGDKFLNTTYCLPLQLAKAKLLGLDCVFISREHTPTAFEHYLDLIKINCNIMFNLERERYNVCGPQEIVPESCKQWVAVHCFNNTGVDRWTTQMRQYVLQK